MTQINTLFYNKKISAPVDAVYLSFLDECRGPIYVGSPTLCRLINVIPKCVWKGCLSLKNMYGRLVFVALLFSWLDWTLGLGLRFKRIEVRVLFQLNVCVDVVCCREQTNNC